MSHRYVADYMPFSFTDGEGVRCSLYVSGCLFKCEGCFNEKAWSFRLGEPYTDSLGDRIVADLGHEAIQGLSLLGGEPFLNTQVCLEVVGRVRATYGHTKDIWCWTGYTFDELVVDSDDKRALLAQIDVLCEGRFEEGLKDLTLPFRGSRNQRVLDAPVSLAAGCAVEWESVRVGTATLPR